MVFQNSCAIFLKKQKHKIVFFVIVYAASSKYSFIGWIGKHYFAVYFDCFEKAKKRYSYSNLCRFLAQALAQGSLHWIKQFFSCVNEEMWHWLIMKLLNYSLLCTIQWPPVANCISTNSISQFLLVKYTTQCSKQWKRTVYN